jgi:hypothetical protein
MEERLTLARLQKQWATLFDEPLSLHTYPASLNNGILVVNVDSPLWLQQLKYFKQAMLKKLESYRIKTIDFRHGSANMSQRYLTGKHSLTNTGDHPAQNKKALADADVTWIEQNLAPVNDPELRDRIRNVMEKALTRKK